MKRRDLLDHLRRHGCRFVREGGRAFDLGEPRQWAAHVGASPSRLPDFTAARICKQLDIPGP